MMSPFPSTQAFRSFKAITLSKSCLVISQKPSKTSLQTQLLQQSPCLCSLLSIKTSQNCLGFNNYQVDNFLSRLLFFSVKKTNPVFITASLCNVTFSQPEREVCSSLRHFQYCKTSLLSHLLERRAQLSLSLQQLGLTDH